MTRARLAIFLLGSLAGLCSQAHAQSGISAQMGVKVTPDSVTIGDPFVLIVRVKVKPGFVAEFPRMQDSTEGKPSRVALIGSPAIERAPGDSLEFRATYRLTAWDVGVQPIPLADVYVRGRAGTGFLPLRAFVFVKSVLPPDTTLRNPRPLRARFPVHKTNWWPLIVLGIAVALGELLWAIYKRYRDRRNAPRDPYDVAMQEFQRIEALHLPRKGEAEAHAMLMAEAMRVYLAAKVDRANISDTPRQLVENVIGAGLADDRVSEVMRESELLKFARGRTTPDGANRIGQSARAIVALVEKQLQPGSGTEAKAA